MRNKVYIYVMNKMADWEIGYVMAELHGGRYFKEGQEPLDIIPVSVDGRAITTMGGFVIMPKGCVDDIQLEEALLLILPGGDLWLEGGHDAILKCARDFLNEKIYVAAICGATFGLAQAGLLDNRAHTSNDLLFLKNVCPTYNGELLYQEQAVVVSDCLITATGIAALQFARQILQELNVIEEAKLTAWYNLYQTSDARYYKQLIQSS